jgi:hypothetical protein
VGVEVPEEDMLTPFATKSDLDALRRELRGEIAIETRALALRLGSLQIITMVLLFAALELT